MRILTIKQVTILFDDGWRTLHPETRETRRSGQFGYTTNYECANCGPTDADPDIRHYPHTQHEEGGYTCHCSMCGCEDIGLNTPKTTFKATKRFTLYPTRPGACQHGLPWDDFCNDCWSLAYGDKA